MRPSKISHFIDPGLFKLVCTFEKIKVYALILLKPEVDTTFGSKVVEVETSIGRNKTEKTDSKSSCSL